MMSCALGPTSLSCTARPPGNEGISESAKGLQPLDGGVITGSRRSGVFAHVTAGSKLLALVATVEFPVDIAVDNFVDYSPPVVDKEKRSPNSLLTAGCWNVPPR